MSNFPEPLNRIDRACSEIYKHSENLAFGTESASLESRTLRPNVEVMPCPCGNEFSL
jgi:hypothetical protein